jgi:glucan biosynthesis protein C
MGGSLSWHHMWFVLYLFVFSMLAIPLINFLKSEKSSAVLTNVENYFSTRWGFISLVIPVSIYMLIMIPISNNDRAFWGDWAYLGYYFAFFVAGMITASSDRLWILLKEKRNFHLTVGSVFVVLIEFLFVVDWEWLQPHVNIDLTSVWIVTRIVIAFTCVFGVVGYAYEYLNRGSRFLKYSNEGIYPFYIIHQTVIVVMAYPMIEWDLSIPVKFLILGTLSFIITVLIYVVLVRPFRITRFLFGMKSTPKVKKLLFEKESESSNISTNAQKI